MIRKAISTALSLLLAASLLTACGANSTGSGTDSEAASGQQSTGSSIAGTATESAGEGAAKYKEFITVDVYSQQAA